MDSLHIVIIFSVAKFTISMARGRGMIGKSLAHAGSRLVRIMLKFKEPCLMKICVLVSMKFE